uniref:Cytotoxic and regulatory T cell molecule n=1 Tax=Strigops habroptila TaxID=2489341 RepID=A0A672UY05_STRHB
MPWTGMSHVRPSLLRDFPGAGGETITLKEGEDLNLRCTLSSDDGSARQWLNPRGFAIFLNTQRGKDQRYKLIHYSKDELSIQLSNVTVHDEGVYKCFYYGIPFKSKNKTVKVLAAPSNPVLEVSRHTERSITLSCYTQGCKPQARITWLLGNGIELPGDTKHKLEADGKKWTTTSALTVIAYGPNSTASCIVRHQALGKGKLMASFQFDDLVRTVAKTTLAPSTLEVDTRVSENEQTTVPGALDFKAAGKYVFLKHVFALQGNIFLFSIPPVTEIAFSGNVTEEEVSRTEAPLPSGNVTVISIMTFDKDVKPEGIGKKEKNLLLPILVAALIFVLLIIVLLFMKKLKKAHGAWKRENDVSDQTLESYKSKSNEDSPGHEKNGHGVNQKSNMQYVTEGYVKTVQKNPRDTTVAINKKQFGCGKETDV